MNLCDLEASPVHNASSRTVGAAREILSRKSKKERWGRERRRKGERESLRQKLEHPDSGAGTVPTPHTEETLVCK